MLLSETFAFWKTVIVFSFYHWLKMLQVFNRIGQELADKYSLAHYDYVHVMYVFVHFLAVDIYYL